MNKLTRKIKLNKKIHCYSLKKKKLTKSTLHIKYIAYTNRKFKRNENENHKSNQINQIRDDQFESNNVE